jgi:REP element-mobilizing transposase RayT
VINRGNYRSDIFRSEGAKLAFEACLFTACAKSNWVLHAFVLMSNHYHLAVETPDGNLVAGMQWLQATFANRFNKRRGTRGHLFQGRYKSLLVEAGLPMGQVCHYIHLNPVRAGVVTVAALKDYRFGNYWYLSRPNQRPAFLQFGTALGEVGDLVDQVAGWQSYHDYLAWHARDGPAGRSQAYVTLSKGWALGSTDFKRALIHDHALAATSRAWEKQGAQEIKTEQWRIALARCLRHTDKTPQAITAGRKSADWKVAIAAAMKLKTQVSNRWLCEQLHMGTPVAVSQLVGLLRRQGGPAAKLQHELTEILKT